MSPRHSVALLADPEDEGRIVQAVDARADLKVVRRCADLPEVRAAVRAGIADLVVLRAAEPDLDALVIEELRIAGAGVVLLVDESSRSQARSLGADALAHKSDAEGVVEALEARIRGGRGKGADDSPPPDPFEDASRPTQPLAPDTALGADAPPSDKAETEEARGRVVAVWGASGAPGRSTLALGIAHALAEDAPTILIDGDLRNPSLAHMAGIPVDSSGIAALARMALRGALDEPGLEGALIPYTDHLSILTGLTTPHRWREVGPAALDAIISAAARTRPWVVVDLAAVSLDEVADETRQIGDRDDTTAAILRRADEVFCVARADVLGISRLAHALAWFGELGASAQPRIVINRVDSAATGPRPSGAIGAALQAIIPGRSAHLIPEDAAVAKGLLKGRSVVAASPKSPAAQALSEAARSLGGPGARAPRRTRRGRRVKH
ncbi:AAA family ATPase [Schaalia hyovaginalis]|uniref:AAA family ATPase n=2 Tax=Schaalia hyovaginalis TaxID=29316 RepID=UPI0026EC8853|nr:AAA family ATPase [Schaalia hyovaginalis]MCI6557494.1 AAA family ATPase [Schaalia hyovaginalis]MDD7554173.1 AAA family ATPase [Schaalia hyovaginalis]MDY3094720.1 AAA family ATPase [Schaalia hyovaginalis]